MTQDAKDRLISLFGDKDRWCRGIDARDPQGRAVHYDDESAVAWDIVGGMCHLFGWKRATKLFGPMSRHLTGRRQSAAVHDSAICAMTALLDYNDNRTTTHEAILFKLQNLPVWHGRRAATQRASRVFAPARFARSPAGSRLNQRRASSRRFQSPTIDLQSGRRKWTGSANELY